MKHSTAIADKLAEKGIHSRVVRLDMALAEYRNNGGSYQEAIERVESAFADQGASRYEFAARTLANRGVQLRNGGEKGHLEPADKAKLRQPSSSPIQRSAGQIAVANKAVDDVPVAAPRNKPGHAKRGIQSIGAIQNVIAKSLFDTTKLPDGRTLREVTWSEVPHLAARYSFLSRVMVAVHRRAVPVDGNARLDTLVTEMELTEIIGAVERLNEIH